MRVLARGSHAISMQHAHAVFADGKSFKLPTASGEGNSQQFDLAFASFASQLADGADEDDSSCRSTFYMPCACQNPTSDQDSHHQLVDARTVCCGDKVFFSLRRSLA